MLLLLFTFVLNSECQSIQSLEGLDFGDFTAWEKEV